MTASQALAAVKVVALLFILGGLAYVGKLFVDGRKAVDDLKGANNEISQLKDAAAKAAKDHEDEKLRLVTEGREAVAAVSKDAMARFSELAKGDARVEKKVKDIYELAKTGDCFFGPLPSGVVDLMRDSTDKGGNPIRGSGASAASARVPASGKGSPDGG